ncbi:unnamed protein product [Polarella glacialis]|uniref:Piezo-type mechanosensitive ion channel component n=1 Tax=Polarella glacialis TaxID=89957 RepID=A0A813LXC2_POLGL|nr:unnamed protein product [Polarella glacialis]
MARRPFLILLLRARRAWFRYAVATVFLAAGLGRRGTPLSDLYLAIAGLLTVLGLAGRCGEPCDWRHLHLGLAVVSLFLLTAASSLDLVCSLGQLPGSLRRVVGMLGLGGIDEEGSGCGEPWRMLPEAVAAAAGTISWLLSSCLVEEAVPTSTLQASNHDVCRSVAVAALLVACAALDCNAFSAAYHLTAVLLALQLAWFREPAAYAIAGAGWLQSGLCAVALAHVAAVVGLSVPAAARNVPSYLVQLLGAGATREGAAQCVAAFSLAQLLLWKPRQMRTSSFAASPSMQAPPASEWASFRQQMAQPLMQSAHDVAAAQTESGLGASEVELEIPLVQPQSSASASVDVTPPRTALSRQQKSRSSPMPAVSTSMYSARSERAYASFGSPAHRRETRPSAASRAEAVGSLEGRFFASADTEASARSSLFSGGSLVPPRWAVAIALSFCQGPVLPGISLMTWPLVWPCLPTMPLFLAGLCLMVIPLRRCSRSLLSLALAYEALCAVALYSFNVYVTGMHGTSWSEVPGTFTWQERLGMQSFLRQGSGSAAVSRAGFVLAQAWSLILLAVFVRCADLAPLLPADSPQAGSATTLWPWQVGQLRLALAAALRWAVMLGRVASVATIVALAMGASPQDASLLGLGYLLLLILLAASGFAVPEHIAGWDGLRGHKLVWQSLFAYSSCTCLALFLWQVLASASQDLVGLHRASTDVSHILGPHLALALLTAVQVRALGVNLPPPPALMQGASLLAQFFSNFGIFVQMGLMFGMVMMPPVSVFSFVVLLLFVGIVAVEQFGPSSGLMALGRRTGLRHLLLTATAVFAALQLPVRYTIMLPVVQQWLERVWPEEAHKFIWSALACQPGQQADSHREVIVVATLMLVSGYLCRGFKFWMRALQTLGAGSSRPVLPHPFLARCLVEVANWSEPVLMLVAYFLLLSPNLLSRLQLAALTALLVSCRAWKYAGGLVSVFSMASLLAQYVLRFGFVGVADKATAQWLGFEWQQQLVGSEVALSVLGIVQHAIQRMASQFPEEWQDLRGDSKWRQSELAAHSALLGAVCLLLTLVFHADSWTLVFVVVVAALVMSGDASRLLAPGRANVWLRLMSLVLVLALASDWVLVTWLPPHMASKPSPEDVSHMFVCLPFDGQLWVYTDGRGPCEHSRLGCSTQKTRCGQAWLDWLGLSGTFSGRTAVQFLVLWSICLLRRCCLGEMARASQQLSLSGSAAPALAINSRLSNREGSEGVEPPLPAQREDLEDGAGVGDPRPLAAQVLLEEVLVPEAPPPSASFLAVVLRPQALHTASAIVLWLSVAGASVFQSQTDAICVGYMLLLCRHVYTAEIAPTPSKPLEARMRALQGIRNFNIVILVFWALFQCPSLPCPYQLDLRADPPSNSSSSMFLSPEQCLALEDHSLLLNGDSSVQKTLGMLLRFSGLRKMPNGAFFDSENLLYILIFLAAATQEIVSSRWSSELSGILKERGELIERRADMYVGYIARWRSLDVSRVETKHVVLRDKLADIIDHLNELRAMWDNRRPVLPDGKRLEHELERERRVRVLDLCLQCGLPPGDVEELLAEFEQAAGGSGLREERVGAEQEQLRRLVDECVLEQVRYGDLRHLQKITDVEEQDMKLELLSRCKLAAEQAAREDREGEDDKQDEQEGEAVKDGQRDSEDEGSEQEECGEAPEERGEGEDERVADPTAVGGRMVADVAGTAGLPTVDGPAVAEDPILVSSTTFSFRAILKWLLVFSRAFCEMMIDDLLFAGDGDSTLQEHRKGNSLLKLLWKGLLSKTFVLLMVAAVIQFISFQCVLSFGTVFGLVCSLMVFPQAPSSFWRGLQVYNLATITAKMLYQTPIFCLDGSIDFKGCSSENEATIHGASWAEVLGLLKVEPESVANELFAPSLWSALWADVLVCFFLFLHCHVLCRGGRMRHSPSEIRLLLEQPDQEDDASDARGADELSDDGGAIIVATADSRNVPRGGLELASSIASRPVEETPAGPAEGRMSMGSELPSGVSSASLESPSVAESVSPRSVRSFGSRLRWWLSESSDMVVGSARMRKPAMDLYSFRFVLSLSCFCILLLFWNALAGSGRSFTAALSSNIFSGTQVLVLILFLAVIVADRALYTWYTQDRPHAVSQTAGTRAARDSPAASVPAGIEPVSSPRLATRRESEAAGRAAAASAPSAVWRRRPSPSPGPSIASSERGCGRPRSRRSFRSRESIHLQPGALSAALSAAEAATELKRSVLAPALQMALLLVQLVTLHAVCISAWASSTRPTRSDASMAGNAALLTLYLLYVLYLCLTSLQLRYDVHMVRGGLGLTHSVDTGPWLLFMTYSVIPFMDEFRVLTDWTVTRTSMNLFMWFKLEDASKNLYRSKCDMSARTFVKPADPRPCHEKFLQGGLLLLALFALIVGPIAYFSTANLFMKDNLVISASLKVNLIVTVAGGASSQLALYDTGQALISSNSQEDVLKFASTYPSAGDALDLNLQQVQFPLSADTFWLVSPSLREQVAQQLSANTTAASLVLVYQFQGNQTTTGRGYGSSLPIMLTQSQVENLTNVLKNTTFVGQSTIDVPCGIQNAVLIDSSGQLSFMGSESSISLTLTSLAASQLPQWSMAMACTPCEPAAAVGVLQGKRRPRRSSRLPAAASVTGDTGADPDTCNLKFRVASEKVSPVPVSEGSSGTSYGVMGIYLGVVYTIGRFLRMVFQDSSKRVIYEELHETELLEDLCNGIYIARITGDLVMEYEFYYELLRIFRSPELLLDISKPKRNTGHFPPFAAASNRNGSKVLEAGDSAGADVATVSRDGATSRADGSAAAGGIRRRSVR